MLAVWVHVRGGLGATPSLLLQSTTARPAGALAMRTQKEPPVHPPAHLSWPWPGAVTRRGGPVGLLLLHWGGVAGSPASASLGWVALLLRVCCLLLLLLLVWQHLWVHARLGGRLRGGVGNIGPLGGGLLLLLLLCVLGWRVLLLLLLQRLQLGLYLGVGQLPRLHHALQLLR